MQASDFFQTVFSSGPNHDQNRSKFKAKHVSVEKRETVFRLFP